MTESAKICQHQGLRARKREATRSAITARARTLTAEQGLNGFTIEQLCEDVGVSRRTFFNYFPSKEDAILGHLLDEFPADAIAEFLAGAEGVQRGPSGVSNTLLADLHRLTCAMVEALGFSREQVQILVAAMKKEPHLMMKMMGGAHLREQEFADLISQREGLEQDDPTAVMISALFGTCSHRASQTFFTATETLDYPELLAQNLRTAHQLFSSSHLTLEGTP